MADRKLVVEIIGDASSLERSFTRSSSATKKFDRDLSRSAKGAIAATVSFRGLGRALVLGSNAFLGGAGIAFAAKQAITEASRVQEEIEKTSVVFGRNARAVQEWSKTLAQSFGVSEGAALEAAGTFGNMLRPLGFGTQAAADMSKRLVELAADMASFNNVKPDVVLQALASGLAGQVRPLRQYGVFLSQARIQQEAVIDGISKTGKNLSQAQKVQAAYNIILKDTKNAQGDVARNTGSLSVAMSKLTAGVQDLEAGLGKTLLPALTEYVNKAAEWLNQTKNQQRIQRDFATAMRDVGEALKIVRDIVTTVDKVTGSFKNTVELLISLKIASVFAGWARAVGLFAAAETAANEAAVVTNIRRYTDGVAAVGSAATLSTGKVNVLRGSLARLGAIGTIAVAIEVVIHHESVDAFFKSLTDKFTELQQGGFTNALAKVEAKAINLVPGVHVDWKSLTKAIDDQTKRNPPVLTPTFSVNPKIQNVTDKTFKQLFPEGLKKAIQDALAAADDLASSAAAAASRAAKGLTAEQRNTFFDNQIARILQRGGLGTIQQQIGALQQANRLIQQRLAQTKDVTRRLNLEDELIQNAAQIKDLQTQAAADALQKRQDAFSEFIADLQLGVTKAQTTSGVNDDIVKLKALQAGIKAEIAEFGRTADLAGQLFDAQQQLKQAQIQKVSAQEFFTLGLGPTGDTRVPLAATLRKQLGTLQDAIQGTVLDTRKNESELSRIRKVLSQSLVPTDVRSKIKQMLDDIQSQLQGHAKNLTKFSHVNSDAILKGLGLDAETTRILRQRISQVGAGGTVPGVRTPAFALAGVGGGTIQVDATVNLDGQKVGRIVTAHQRRQSQRRSDSRRGPFAGRN